jgi:hypothetical protein
LATRCLKKLADDNEHCNPKATHVLKNDFYVDDLLSGTSTVEEAIEIQQELSSLLQSAGFTLRKWASNSSAFLNTIPKELQETQHTHSLDNEEGYSTLGLMWLPQTDQLQVRDSNPAAKQPGTTKRSVLSITASIFDSLGLLSPSLIAYKIFLQQLWQDKLQWDQPLPHELQQEWNQLLQTIPQLSKLKINRQVISRNAANIQLHGFCYASERAYGACFYIRSIDPALNISC